MSPKDRRRTFKWPSGRWPCVRGALLGAAAFALALVAAVLLMPPPAEDAEPLGALASRHGLDPGARPTWREGDAWRVQFDDNDPICWFVVAHADAEGYRQGAWCPTDEAPIIATQLATRGVEYAGTLTPELGVVFEEEPIRWYDWPLEDGKSWSTSWHGQTATVTVSWSDEEERYQLVLCREGGACAAEYDYDPALGWWSRITFESGYEFRVHERVEDWDRGHVLADAIERRHAEYGGVNLDGVAPARSTFDVDEGEDLVVVEIQRAGVHHHDFNLYRPAGSLAWTDSSSSLTGPEEYVWDVVEADAGQWSIGENLVTDGMLHNRIWTVTLSRE